jgi:hypothetical protein
MKVEIKFCFFDFHEKQRFANSGNLISRKCLSRKNTLTELFVLIHHAKVRFQKRWAPVLFSRSRARTKKSAKAPSAKVTKRKFAHFLPPTLEAQFQRKNARHGENKGP